MKPKLEDIAETTAEFISDNFATIFHFLSIIHNLYLITRSHNEAAEGENIKLLIDEKLIKSRNDLNTIERGCESAAKNLLIFWGWTDRVPYENDEDDETAVDCNNNCCNNELTSLSCYYEEKKSKNSTTSRNKKSILSRIRMKGFEAREWSFRRPLTLYYLRHLLSLSSQALSQPLVSVDPRATIKVQDELSKQLSFACVAVNFLCNCKVNSVALTQNACE